MKHPGLEFTYKHGVLKVWRGNKLTMSCKPYDRTHAEAIKARWKAWDKLGWPYIPEDERE